MSEVNVRLGALLKLERERQGIKLGELAEGLRLPEANLEYIERGDSASLPSEIYFGLFAKSYAEAVGIDYAATVQAIKEDLEEEPEPPKPKKKPTRSASEETIPELEDDSPAKSERFLGLKRDLWRKLGWGSAALVVVVGGFFVGRQLLRDMERPEDIAGDTEPTEATSDAWPEGSREASYANYDWNVPKYEEPEDLRLKLTARGGSWAAVFADGDTAIYRNLVVGRVYEVTAKYRMTLSVAVPRMVDIDLNGVRINPVSPTTGRITRVRITQVNVDSFLNFASEAQSDSPPARPEPVAVTPASSPPDTTVTADTAGTQRGEADEY